MRDTQSLPSNSANTSVSLPSGSVIDDRQLDRRGRPPPRRNGCRGRSDRCRRAAGRTPPCWPAVDTRLELRRAAAASAPLANTSRAVVDRRLVQVHRRRADEAGDEARRRAPEHLVGRADLLDIAVAHDDDAVGQRHRLDLVVGDVDHRRSHLGVQLLDLGAHLRAQLGVEVGERLVEQEHVGVAHDGAAHGDALALAAGKLRRPPLQQSGRGRGSPRPRRRAARSRPAAAPAIFSEKPIFSRTVMCG